MKKLESREQIIQRISVNADRCPRLNEFTLRKISIYLNPIRILEITFSSSRVHKGELKTWNKE